jgi:uncharacterized protein YebE (UPF0316 family)
MLSGAAFIFLARCTDVTMGVFRILMLVKGRKIVAAGLGFFEVMVYITVMNAILGGGRSLSFMELVAYCGGYAAGNILGSILERKLMSAFTMVEVITEKNENASRLGERLRDAGFGVTVLTGEGRNGLHLVFKIICNRNKTNRVSEIASHYGGFIIHTDIKGVSGGYFGTMVRK